MLDQRHLLVSWAHKPNEANRFIQRTKAAARQKWRTQRQKAAKFCSSEVELSNNLNPQNPWSPFTFDTNPPKQEQVFFSYLVDTLLCEIMLIADIPKHDLTFLKDRPMSAKEEHNQFRLIDKSWNRLHVFDRRVCHVMQQQVFCALTMAVVLFPVFSTSTRLGLR